MEWKQVPLFCCTRKYFEIKKKYIDIVCVSSIERLPLYKLDFVLYKLHITTITNLK